MKTVQGTNRSYQLVQKTKRKDIDGVIYLVAGEKDIWVKLLKDKSPQKETEVREQIRNGYGNLFEIPLDVVTNDASGFLGYTFKGEEMEVVPVKVVPPTVSHKPTPKPKIESGNINEKKGVSYEQNISYQNSDYQQKRKNTLDNWHNKTIILIGLFVCGLLLFAMNYFWLNFTIWQQLANYIGYAFAQECLTFSLMGIVPGIMGAAVVITVMKRVMSKPVHIVYALITEMIAFAMGVLMADFCIALLVVIITAVIGTVQEYMGAIIMVIVIIYIIKGLLKR